VAKIQTIFVSFTINIHKKFLNYFSDIRIQQRNGRKTLTTVQGIPGEIDFKKVLKAFKKVISSLRFTNFLTAILL
jgi:translation initiation factor SUI1